MIPLAFSRHTQQLIFCLYVVMLANLCDTQCTRKVHSLSLSLSLLVTQHVFNSQAGPRSKLWNQNKSSKNVVLEPVVITCFVN
jgi:hypothetical protein